MSEQQFRGTLASGGTFNASAQGLDIFDPAGNPLASFSRDVISGISRDGQVVTVERHNDTIVTLTAASITDAVGLEQYVLDVVLAPPAVPEAAPPLAFDAFDTQPAPADPDREPAMEPEPPPPATPPVEPAPPEPPVEPALPPAEPPAWERPAAEEPIAPMPTVAATAPVDELPIGQAPPPLAAPPPTAYEVETQPEEPKGRRWWLWGCLGCGGLILLTIICVGVLLATEVIDPDDFDDDDDNNNNNGPIVVTNTPDGGAAAEWTPTPAIDGATPTDGSGGGGGGGGGGDATAEVPEGALQVGDSATVGGLEVTLGDVRTDTGGTFPPEPGNQYVILNFEVTNTTSEPTIVSTLLQFALQTSAGESYGVALFADTQGSLDGDLAAGDTVEGEVAFEVPEGSGPYTALYSDVFTSETAAWVVSP